MCWWAEIGIGGAEGLQYIMRELSKGHGCRVGVPDAAKRGKQGS